MKWHHIDNNAISNILMNAPAKPFQELSDPQRIHLKCFQKDIPQTLQVRIFHFKQHGRSQNETMGNQKPLAKNNFGELLLIHQVPQSFLA